MFTAKEHRRQATVVLPAAKAGRIGDASLRRWLSRSYLEDADAPREMFVRVMDVLGQDVPAEGLAALRFWGQTGQRPNVWIAAADPIHLEPRLDFLRLHALEGPQSPNTDLRAIVDFLQECLGPESVFAFAQIGQYAYLRGDQPIATAEVSASAIDGLEPDMFMPSGEEASGYLALSSELQMSLHDHEINLRREEEGLMPVNSIWLWGGGMAPQKAVKPLPPFIGEDPLFQGYWKSCTGVVAPWPGSFADCLEIAVQDFVALPPGDDALVNYLSELREQLRRGRIDRLMLLFRDGLSARIGRFDAFHIWRKTSSLL
jgi:hypothetical protein